MQKNQEVKIMIKRKAAISVVVTLTLVLSSSIGAFATTSDSSTVHFRDVGKISYEQITAINDAKTISMKKAIENSVEDGTLTQDHADQLVENNHDNKLDLTEEQRTVINDARTNSMEKAIENLVKDGTLTQEEADSILTVPEKKNFAGEKGNDNIGLQKESELFMDLSDEQIQSLKEKVETLYKGALAELVSNGTITQEIVDQVQEMPIGMNNRTER